MAEPCPKCTYTRTAADEAPDWQCPKCGIAIAKYIALQKEAKERRDAARSSNKTASKTDAGADTPTPARTSTHTVVPNQGLINPSEWNLGRSILGKLVYVIMFLSVSYFARLHYAAPGAQDELTQGDPAAQKVQPSTFFQPAAAPARAAGPNVPVEGLAELFKAARERGEADGLSLVTSEDKAPGLSQSMPLNEHVERMDALSGSACNRYRVTLMQGGSSNVNTRGQTVKSAITFRYVYSVNYCVDGMMPAEGRDLKVESN